MLENEKVLKAKERCRNELFELEQRESYDNDPISLKQTPHTNVVSMDTLRKIQSDTLRSLKNNLCMTFGPMGSNTKIITGNDAKNIQSSYSKDGLKVLKSILNSGPIEMSIVEEIVEATRHVESEVGDGTTSTVILASLIFDNLINIQKKFVMPPYSLIRSFKSVVSSIEEKIKENKRECTLDDIYKISMISTNGNEEVSQNITDIYKEYGMNVDLSVGISNSSESKIKAYDGLTITEGMSDPVYINNPSEGTSEIHNAKIYHFADPIDTMDMIAMFEQIINHNLYEPMENDEEVIPTVITCPRISKDMSATLQRLAQQLYQYDNQRAQSRKPPILIITNVLASDEAIMDDIANLCGCKSIRKYIDPKMLERDRANGSAPTIENVHEFAGEAELVVADNKKTKFINPIHMRVYDENGEVHDDPIYTAMLNFLETEIKQNDATDSVNDKGLMRKRLSALKANMVDYLVGGITVSDRDVLKDLVEDAIKNCKSAASSGVGYAANFEGLNAAYKEFAERVEKEDKNHLEYSCETYIAYAILEAYINIASILYNSVCLDQDEIDEHIMSSILDLKGPYNISSGFLPKIDEYKESDVLCSIMLDINILGTLSKIITVMVTCNQCLLQSPSLNNY